MSYWNTRTEEWAIDLSILHLSHGSFGATPRRVLSAQQKWHARIESAPDSFFSFELRPLLRHRRAELGKIVGAAADNIVLTSNATSAMNTVLRSLVFAPGDEIVFTNHIYPTVHENLLHLQKHSGIKLSKVIVPFPVQGADEILESIQNGISEKTKLLVVDHITSPTGLIFPIEKIIKAAHAKGVKVLVDGAHAPGMVPLQLDVLKPDFYAGNLHKWMCAAKGCAFLYVEKKWHNSIFPLTITLAEGEMWERFEWTGTCDAAAWLSLDTTFKFFAELNPPVLQARNHELMSQARALLAQELGTKLPHPDSVDLYGSIACIQVPYSGKASLENLRILRKEFFDAHRIEVPFTSVTEDALFVRPSAHCYNSLPQYEKLAAALKTHFL